jgi:serine protease Do
MIRRTLGATQLATFSIDLPNERAKGMPTPTGTGFFVSDDGWFITAAHVVTKDNSPNGPPRDDIEKGWLMKEARPGKMTAGMCQHARLELVDPAFDFALLKVDFARNSDKEHLKGRTGFHHLIVSTRQLEEGEAVYAFGYPLSTFELLPSQPNVAMGRASQERRTTSAIVAATMDVTTIVSTGDDPQVYVLDKALNYGNSGGPIVAVETGHVHALCSRFQPMKVPQHHLRDAEGNPLVVMMRASMVSSPVSVMSRSWLPFGNEACRCRTSNVERRRHASGYVFTLALCGPR